MPRRLRIEVEGAIYLVMTCGNAGQDIVHDDRARFRADLERTVGRFGWEVLAFVVWFLFGAVLVPVAFHHFEPPVLAYALLSLSVVRMLPVAVSLVGSGVDRETVLFLGWFGPRGLASVAALMLWRWSRRDVLGLGKGVLATP